MKIAFALLFALYICGCLSQDIWDATEASVDQYGQYGGQAFYFDDLNLPNQEQRWDFKDQSGRFITTSDGAVLLGTIAPVNQSDSTYLWDVVLVFTNANSTGSPKLELNYTAYAPRGPVDPANWTYFSLDTARSKFIGLGDNLGFQLTLIEGMPGMPLQVGEGASGKSILYGASAWFNYTLYNQSAIVATGVVDTAIDLTSVNVSSGFPQNPSTPTFNCPGAFIARAVNGTAFLVDQSYDFMFDSGRFYEYGNYSGGILTGLLQPVNSAGDTCLSEAWEITLVFNNSLGYWVPSTRLYAFDAEKSMISGLGGNFNNTLQFSLDGPLHVGVGAVDTTSSLSVSGSLYFTLSNITSVVQTGVANITVYLICNEPEAPSQNGTAGTTTGTTTGAATGAAGTTTTTGESTTSTTGQATTGGSGSTTGTTGTASCQGPYALRSAQNDSFGTNGGQAAVVLDPENTTESRWNFSNNTVLVLLQSEGRAVITANLTALDTSNSSWEAVLAFTTISNISSVTPLLELSSNAYYPQGPIDPTSWSYFQLDPNVSFVFEENTATVGNITSGVLQVGYGANGKNVLLGASGIFNISLGNSTVSIELNVDVLCQAASTPGSTTGGLIPNVSSPLCSQAFQVSAASVDQYGQSGGQAIFFNNSLLPLEQYRYDFTNPGSFAENDGGAILTGTIAPVGDLTSGDSWSVILVLRSVAPTGTPKLELNYTAYAPEGPIDSNTWRFYALDANRSALVGLRDNTGLIIELADAMPNMPFQIGFGASGKSVQLGGSSWFTFTLFNTTDSGRVATGVSGNVDFAIDLTCADGAAGLPIAVSSSTTGSDLTSTTGDLATSTTGAAATTDVSTTTSASTTDVSTTTAAATTGAATTTDVSTTTSASTTDVSTTTAAATTTNVSTTTTTSGTTGTTSGTTGAPLPPPVVASPFACNFPLVANDSSVNSNVSTVPVDTASSVVVDLYELTTLNFQLVPGSGSLSLSRADNGTITQALFSGNLRQQGSVNNQIFALALALLPTANATPVELLFPEQYSTINISNWQFFSVDLPNSQLYSGVGFQFPFSNLNSTTTTAQIGYGANNRNLNFGLYGAFDILPQNSLGAPPNSTLTVHVDLVCP